MPTSKTSPRPQLRLVVDTDADAFKDAMEFAGKFLARRARSEREVRTKLVEGDFTTDVVERTIERLVELELVDDHDFARQWIEIRVRRRGLGAGALISELQGKGISRETAEDALAESDPDETAQATELAVRFARKVAATAPWASRRAKIMEMLARRGIERDAAEAAIRVVLPRRAGTEAGPRPWVVLQGSEGLAMWPKNKNHVFPDVRTNKRERSLRPFEFTAAAKRPMGPHLPCCPDLQLSLQGVSLTSRG